MKKMILGAFGLLLFAASCSDDDNNGNGDSGNGTEDNLVTPAITARITEQVAQLFVIIDFYKSLSVFTDHFYDFLLTSVFVCPMSDKCPVAHMCFFYFFSWFDTDNLGKQSVHDIAVILGFIGVRIWRKA